MKKVSVLLIIAIFLVGCKEDNKTDFSVLLDKKWLCISIADGKSGMIEIISRNEFLIFENDSNYFYFDYFNENPYLCGNYTLKDSIVSLSFVKNKQGNINQNKIRTFKIEKCTNDTLILNENGHVYLYIEAGKTDESLLSLICKMR